jgi:Tol biopolymer transport system component
MYYPNALPRIYLLVGAAMLAACAENPFGPASEGGTLVRHGAYGQWLWSRDGSEIIYLTYPYATTPAVVAAVHTETGAVRTLASSSGPGGRRILNRGLAGSHFGIEVVLSADGSHVYYLSTTTPQHHESAEGVQLHRVRLRGATAAAPELVASGVGYHGYAVSPDMGLIAYNDGDGVHLLELATGERDVISVGGGYGVVPDSWAPDGRSLIMMQSRPGSGGRGFLWLDLASGQPRQWSLPAGLHPGVPPQPHPVIRWIGGRPAVLVTNDTGTQLVHCDVGTGTCAVLRALGGSDVASPVSWSADGTHVAFWRSSCTKWEPNTFWGGTYCTRYANDLRLLAVEAGHERSITTATAGSSGGDVPVFAPDGRRVAYTAGWVDRPGGHGLRVQALP